MNEYIIEKAWSWTKDKQIRIKSDNLEFVEFCNGYGAQSNHSDNNDKISELCKKIADNIREIEKLNNNLPF